MWRNLNEVKNSLTNIAPDHFNDHKTAVHQSLGEIQLAAKKMYLCDAELKITEYLMLWTTPKENGKLILSELNQLWHFFWGLEDELVKQLDQDTCPSGADISNRSLTPSTPLSQTENFSDSTPSLPQQSSMSLDVFFDQLWPHLAQLRKTIDSLDTNTSIQQVQDQLAQVRTHLNKTHHLEPSVYLDDIEVLLNATTAENVDAQRNELGKKIQTLYTYYWELEDQLGSDSDPLLSKNLDTYFQHTDTAESNNNALKAITSTETHDAHTQATKHFFNCIGLPQALLDALTHDAFSKIGQLLLENINCYLLYCDIEHDDTLASHTFELLESDIFDTILSASEWIEGRSVFHFLVHSKLSEHELRQALAKLDPSGTYLRIQKLPTNPSASNTPLITSPFSAANQAPVSDPVHTNNCLAQLQNTLGELLTVKANLGQLSQSITEFDLFHFIDKTLTKYNGKWSDAKHTFRERIQHHNTKLTDLLQAQEDVDRILEKLQNDVNDIRETSLNELFNNITRWYEQTASKHKKAPFLRCNETTLKTEHLKIDAINLPLRQLLFLFQNYTLQDINTRSHCTLTLNATGSAYEHVISACADQGHISMDQLHTWGLPTKADPTTWLQSTHHLGSNTTDSERALNFQMLRAALEPHRIQLTFSCNENGWIGFQFRIPNDNHILDGIVVMVQETYYIFPIHCIQRIVSFSDIRCINTSASHHKAMIELDQEIIPLLQLKPNSTSSISDRQIVLIIAHQQQPLAILVNELIGVQQVLVPPMHGQLTSTARYSGCAALGIDKIGIVVNPEALL